MTVPAGAAQAEGVGMAADISAAEARLADATRKIDEAGAAVAAVDVLCAARDIAKLRAQASR